ncbi:hypothetical protein [Noviherbaspirillum saxi]|uniref:hypothetical protein n=1 Tax=Noviherbaspirillum saxi TaxID=2320863 RepID=UPI0011C3554E|nr:hypothetical protein [Noviherbaspirillum saxi]
MEPVTQETVEQVNTFLQRFIDPAKTPTEQAEFFAPGVDYYDHGIVDKAHIVKDVERYVRRWPTRTYRLAIVEYINPDPQSNRVFVSYVIDYEVANDSNAVHGQANYGAVIADIATSPKIEWIRERVTQRRSPFKDQE